MSTCGFSMRAQQAVGHLLAILVERRVHRRDDEVEGGEAVVGEIERAVGLMSHSMPASSRTPTPSRVHRADARGVRERARLVEAVGHRQRLGCGR